ncbi:cAMP-binding domain of CRP or a regulatory subunit of cAMP-dependent protein kinases [Quadrisphaera sp. DSM 44207]|nr:cAMP-binding domain of CRP or a regulatory subunit of cAMP-dependent protein kinases [Quadrisphaera sp. DSM 44207]
MLIAESGVDVDDRGADGRRNRLLAALPEPVYQRCTERLEPVELGVRQLLFEAEEPIQDVYFPLTAVASLVIAMSDGATVEVATVGSEGVVGLPVFLGAQSLPMRSFAQVPGRALRMDAETFRDVLADTDGPFTVVLQRYTQTIVSQMAQNVACNRLHSIEQRACRWLLMTADRVDGPRFALTQEFLAHMLGVRRASVTEVAGRLAHSGSITYSRGVVTVLDRDQLAAGSCECYGVIRDVLERMLGDPGSAADGHERGPVPTPR